MNQSAYKAKLAYANTQVQTHVETASPHRLIQMLMEGALDKMTIALGAMTRKQWHESGKQLGIVISIVDALRVSLDHNKGPELAANLEALYDYMKRQLLVASSNHDEAVVQEVIVLMKEVKAGWDEIA